MRPEKQPITTLYIEGNQADFHHLQGLLHRGGDQAIQLHHAPSLEEGLQHLEQHQIDRILLAVSSPKERAVRHYERLRQAAPALPLLLLVQPQELALARTLLAKGADGYLVKWPHDPRRSLERILDPFEAAIDGEPIEPQDRARAALDTLPEAIGLLDGAGILVACNAAWQALAGQGPLIGSQDRVGTRYLQQGVARSSEEAEMRGAACQGLEAVLARAQESFTLQYDLSGASGQRRGEMRIQPYADEKMPGAIVLHRELSGHEGPRPAPGPRDPFELFLQTISDYVYVTELASDGSWHNLHLSNYLEQLAGYSLEEFRSDWNLWSTLIHPDDREAAANQLARFTRGEDSEIEYRIKNRDGKQLWVRDTGRVARIEGERLRVYGVISNITSLKEAETAARRLADQMHRLATMSQSLIGALTIEEILQQILQAVQQLLSYDRFDFFWVDEREGQFYAPQLPELDHLGPRQGKTEIPLDEGIAGHVARTGKGEYLNDVRQEPRALLCPGEEAPCRHLIAVPIQRDGKTLAVLILVRSDNPPFTEDEFELVQLFVTQGANAIERAHLFEKVAASEEKYRTLFEESKDAIFITSSNGRFIDVNPAAVELFGYESKEEVLALDIPHDIYVDPADRIRLYSLLAHQGYVEDYEFRIKRKDGEQRVVLESSTLVRAADGSALYNRGILRDVTDRKRAENALREANDQLTRWVKELEERTRAITLLNEMGQLLQACSSAQEAYIIIAQGLQQLFPELSGALLIGLEQSPLVEVVAEWGTGGSTAAFFGQEECWALRRGREHIQVADAPLLFCRHLSSPPPPAYACLPLIAQGETLGVLHVSAAPDSQEMGEAKWQFAKTVASHIALALASLRLRERLQDQLTRDPLTALYNRHYLAESLERELRRAELSGQSLALMRVSVDSFRWLREESGDEICNILLQRIAALVEQLFSHSGIPGRTADDQISILLPGHSREEAAQQGLQLLRKARTLSLHHGGQRIGPLLLSVGIALYPEHGNSRAALERAADLALREAREADNDQLRVAR